MREEKGLVSAIVLNDNDGDLIFEALDSILCQDYPNIELLVSSDASGGFNQAEITEYISARKGKNIRRVVVRQNEETLGTVRHLEAVRDLCAGEYFLTLFADDCWAAPDVFSAFVSRFEALGPKAEWVASQVEIRNEKLEKTLGLFVTDDVAELLLTGDMKRLTDVELGRSALPGVGSAFRRGFFDKIGRLSEHYSLIEDYTAHLRWLRMGETVYYLDQTTAYRRRENAGRGRARDTRERYERHLHDLITMFQVEIEPFKARFSAEGYEEGLAAFKLNRAIHATLRQKLTVCIAHFTPKRDCFDTLRTCLTQDSANFSLIIGCRREHADRVIEYVNNDRMRFKRPGLRQVRLMTDKEGLPEQAYRAALKETAGGDDGYTPVLEAGRVCKDRHVFAQYVAGALGLDGEKAFDRDAFIQHSTVPAKDIHKGETPLQKILLFAMRFRLDTRKEKLFEISRRNKIIQNGTLAAMSAGIALALSLDASHPAVRCAEYVAIALAIVEAAAAGCRAGINLALRAGKYIVSKGNR